MDPIYEAIAEMTKQEVLAELTSFAPTADTTSARCWSTCRSSSSGRLWPDSGETEHDPPHYRLRPQRRSRRRPGARAPSAGPDGVGSAVGGTRRKHHPTHKEASPLAPVTHEKDHPMTIRVSYKQLVGRGVYRWTVQREVSALTEEVLISLHRDAAADAAAITQIMLGRDELSAGRQQPSFTH
jgi:hypothetical protein